MVSGATGLIGLAATGSTGYLLVTHGARIASAITDFGVKTIPAIFNQTVWLASKVSESFANSLATNGSQLGNRLVDFGRNYSVFANTSPIAGAVAGIGISLFAFISDVAMVQIGILRNYPYTRLILSHILAGGAACGYLAVAAKVGLVVGGLTFSGVITITATALVIALISRSIFALISCCCCGSNTDEDGKEKEEPIRLPHIQINKGDDYLRGNPKRDQYPLAEEVT